MSSSAVALVMLAAIAHASWNLFGKQAAATGAARFIWLLAVAACVVYLPVVVATVVITRPHLAALNWVFLAGSGVLHSGYFLFLQRGYRLGDLSAVYPIGRGSGAMLAAFGGIVLLGERPNGYVIAGIVAIIGGVLVIGQPGRAARPAAGAAVLPGPGGPGGLGGPAGPADPVGPAGPGSPAGAAPPPRAVSFALVTGVFIACYTIWDAYAVSHLHTQPIVQCYASFVVMGAVFAPFALKDRERLSMVWHAFGRQVLGAAVLAPLAYILVLTALSFTAVAAVAPAREVSVLFGVVLGRRLLGEGHLARRLTAGAAMVTGIILIAVA